MNNRDEFVEPFNSGVKDSNGVYICNGDTILEEHLTNGHVTDKAIGTVKYETGCFFIDMGRLGTYNLRGREQYENTIEYSDKAYVIQLRFTIIHREIE